MLADAIDVGLADAVNDNDDKFPPEFRLSKANRRKKDWKKALGRYREVPRFVGEWGGTDQDLEFGRELASILRERGLGWTAWSWSDFPRLVSAAGYTPTTFGSLVRDELFRVAE